MLAPAKVVAVALCSYEGQDLFPYNAGIMLMNMPYMRKTNKAFLDWILAQKNGLYYPGKADRLTQSTLSHTRTPIRGRACPVPCLFQKTLVSQQPSPHLPDC